MTEATSKPPLVRPGFLKWSVLAFALLLPVVVHSIWDYVEQGRFGRAVQGIQQKGEPSGLYAIRPAGGAPPPPSSTAPTAEAQRDYRAAAALASDFREDNRFRVDAVAVALQSDQWPADASTVIRSEVGAYGEALAFADRAAALPFDGFSPWISYNYFTSDLFAVQRLSAYRAILHALDGDSEGAVDSLYTEVRLGRALGTRAFSQQYIRAANVVQVIERTKAPAAALASLGAAFDELDTDDNLADWFMGLRGTLLNSYRTAGSSWWQTVERPWTTHVLNGQLETFARLVTAAREPWPQRIDDTIAIGGFNIFSTRPAVGSPSHSYFEDTVVGNASQTAGLRSLRVAVALEQYRRDHAEQLPAALAELVPAYIHVLPIDPFSGRPLLLKKEADGYSVYSVGTNRRDDGAMDVNKPFYGVFPKQYPADVGVRVVYR